MSILRRTAAVALWHGLTLAPVAATAGGFANPYQSTTVIGTAFAGASARSDDASFFLYNPATISGLQGAQISVTALGFAPNVQIEPSRANSPLGANVTGDGGSGNMISNALAGSIAAAIPVGNGLTLGLGFSTPFATDVTTAPNWAGRYHLLKSKIVGLDGTGAVSWQAASWLALAAGVQVQRMENRLENLAVIPAGNGAFLETAGYLKTSGWAAGPVAGIVLTPITDTRIGISWKSGLNQRMQGTAGAYMPGLPVQQARYDLALPSSLTVGIEHRQSADLRLFAEAQWSGWKRFTGFDISYASGQPNDQRPVQWQDTWLAAVGIGYRIAPATELTAGLSHETAASKQGSGTTVSPDAAKLMLGAGVIHDVSGLGRFSVSFAHVAMQDVPVTASNAASGQLQGTLKGRFDILSVGYAFKW